MAGVRGKPAVMITMSEFAVDHQGILAIVRRAAFGRSKGCQARLSNFSEQSGPPWACDLRSSKATTICQSPAAAFEVLW
jgi:hypothetical protein